jgi:hypothetical protein
MDPALRVPGQPRSQVVLARRVGHVVVLFFLLLFLTVFVMAALVIVGPEVSQARSTSYVSAHPDSIDFGKKHVGDTYYKRTRITNVSDQSVRLLVSAGLPDDFGFGLEPGSTCPVLDGGAVVAPGDSCYAVVRFTPTEFFVGWFAQGEMWADSFDPVTGELLEHFLIPVTGTAVL